MMMQTTATLWLCLVLPRVLHVEPHGGVVDLSLSAARGKPSCHAGQCFARPPMHAHLSLSPAKSQL